MEPFDWHGGSVDSLPCFSCSLQQCMIIFVELIRTSWLTSCLLCCVLRVATECSQLEFLLSVGEISQADFFAAILGLVPFQ